MARGGAIAVNIITTFDAGDIQKAQKELARLADTIQKPGDKLKDLGEKFQATGAKITSAGVGISKSVGAVSAAFIAFGVSAVKAAAQAEAEQNRLRQVLLATGLASEKQIVALNAQAKALENLGVVSAGNVTITQSQLATFDLQASTIERLTPAILDYVTAEKGATASAEEFKSMTNGLAQALQGNFASLTKTGFVLDETTKNLIKNGTEAQRSAALVEVLNSTYKGFNATLRDTTEGRLQVMRNGFADLQTRIGEGLLPVMESFLTIIETKFVPFVEKMVTKFEQLDEQQRMTIVQLVLFGAAIGPIIILVGSLTTAIGKLIKALAALKVAASFLLALAGPVKLLIAALAALGTFIVSSDQKLMAETRAKKANALAARLLTEDKRDLAAASRALIPETEKVTASTLEQTDTTNKAAEAAKKLADKLKAQAKAIREVNTDFQKFARDTSAADDTMESLLVSANQNLIKFQQTAGNTTLKVDRLIARLSNLGSTIQEQLSSALTIAKGRLEAAQSAYDSFADSVKNSISGVLNFGNALQVSQDEAKKTSFMEALTKQANSATAFADKIKKLVALGLSKEALQQVLAAGVESGSLIADSIIEGGETVVNQVNSLVAAVESVAKSVGINAADAYYKAGLDLAKSIVQGILDQINAAAGAIAAAIAAAAAGRNLPVTVPQGGTTPATVGTGGLQSAAQIGIPLPQLESDLAAQVAENKRRAARLAAGGLGANATEQLREKLKIGRISADELRTDIRTFEPAGSTSSNVININVNAGMGTDGAQVGEEIISAIKKYERISGPVFVSAG